jgi:CHAD domain-containing protein
MNSNYITTNEKIDSAGGCSFKYDYLGTENMTVKDTYEYLLVKNGSLLLEKDNGEICFYNNGVKYDFEGCDDPQLRYIIDPIILPRVLLDKHEISISRYSVVMLDDIEKTIAKGELLGCEIAGKKQYMLNLTPLRGYDKEVAKALGKVTCQSSRDLGEGFITLLKETNDEMVDYSAKPVIKLQPDMQLSDVMGDIYSHLIYVMSKNTDGIINDIDIEYLHDFRVSVRRTRSALSLVRGVYSKDIEKEFRGRFRELGDLTGLARDMDVYMDSLDYYSDMLPEWLKEGMDELAVYFEKTREDEYKKLAKFFKSKKFNKLRKDWSKVIGSKKSVAKLGKKDVLSVAKSAIYEAFKEIERQASVMTVETHSDAVHDIRISFKKIRYLLEFYSSLFDKEKIGPMLKEMKVLQDSLGDHNDYYVQQLMLEELVEQKEWGALTLSACGFLSAKLAEKQAAECKRSLKLIIAFMGYKKLFGEIFK